MGFFRLMLLAAILWIVWRLVARALRGTPEPPRARGAEQDYLPLTRCPGCGAHIPQPASGDPALCERCRSR